MEVLRNEKLDNSDFFNNCIWYDVDMKATMREYKKNMRLDYPSKRWGHISMNYKDSMLIFGGRHSQRSMVNIYSFDFFTMTWTKYEAFGGLPPARDSHSALIVREK
jgi:hypothetical protein